MMKLIDQKGDYAKTRKFSLNLNFGYLKKKRLNDNRVRMSDQTQNIQAEKEKYIFHNKSINIIWYFKAIF